MTSALPSRIRNRSRAVIAAATLVLLACTAVLLLPRPGSEPSDALFEVMREIAAVIEAEPQDAEALGALTDRFPSGRVMASPAGVYWPHLSRADHALLSQEIEGLDLSEGHIRAHPLGVMFLLFPPDDRQPHLLDARAQGEG